MVQFKEKYLFFSAPYPSFLHYHMVTVGGIFSSCNEEKEEVFHTFP